MRHDFELRARRYELLHRDARIGSRTFFFAAASVISEVFARSEPSGFMQALSRRLERFNLKRAARIREGLLYATGTPALNTVHFIGAEQRLVQVMLDRLKRRSKRKYIAEIEAADRALHELSKWYCQLASDAHRELRDAVLAFRARHRRLPRFACRNDREVLGNLLARRIAGS